MTNTEIITFGCRLNIHDSAVIQQHVKETGLKNTIIFNSCAVTAEAERQVRQQIRKARRQHPEKSIIVTGCAAQISPQIFAEMEEVDYVLGNDLKLKKESWNIDSTTESVRINDIMSIKETASSFVQTFPTHARAFVQVQNGCNHRCTFCVIPYGRGNSSSVPLGDIVTQIRNLQDYKEIVLTGVNLTSYGLDLPGNPSLGQMIRRLLALIPDLPRLRLSSLDPAEIDEDLWRLIETEPRLMPHLHLSVQAGDDMILKRMKRRHTRADIVSLCQKARQLRPDIVFGADMIAGFPTETAEMFKRSHDLIEDCDLAFLHVFPYSERGGTPAAKMPAVPVPVRKERAALLRKAGAQQFQKLGQKMVGQTARVLIEKNHTGHGENFAPIKIPHGQAGQLYDVTVHDFDGKFLVAA